MAGVKQRGKGEERGEQVGVKGGSVATFLLLLAHVLGSAGQGRRGVWLPGGVGCGQGGGRLGLGPLGRERREGEIASG